MDFKKRKVFISYNSKDKEFIHKLVADLREHGVDFWIDELEMGIGDSLIDEIQDGIGEARHFLVILSTNSINSKWVKKDLNTALSIEIESDSTRK